MNSDRLIDLIADETGFDREDPDQVLDSIVPGICRDPDCLSVQDNCEPDADHNYCPECGRNSVVAVTVLMGVI
ncbi:hypothetical protein [Telmatospirillum sp.]|uniref:hypothetical protein n=1 Tax=Telmatospirillum sp. TaxID=2079197 RepID=UPI00284D6146|nr:hypothetical protein [Telmatospirillum sp.]MDR3436406.1 hypothetical protein [Telmatospirillum sp.]